MLGKVAVSAHFYNVVNEKKGQLSFEKPAFFKVTE